MTKPLTASERTRLAADLEDLAKELRAPHAAHVQTAVANTADDRYPATASGGAPMGTGGGGELTPTEAKAARRERAAEAAETTLKRQRLIQTMARQLLLDLLGFNPDRPTALWPCGHIRHGTYKRCLECGGGATVLRCENDHCRNEITAGGQRRRVIAMDQGGRELLECDRCYKWRTRHQGMTWGYTSTESLALREGLVVAGEAYHAG